MLGGDMLGGMMGGMQGGGSANSSSMEHRRIGVNLATITDIDDPEGYGRVKCRFITGDEDVEETEWAYVATPFGGNGSGIYFHPHVGDVVLLAFEEGDVHSPFVVGSVWWKNREVDNKPPVELEDGNEKNNIYLISTPKGNMITLSDEDGKEMIEVKSKSGNVMKLDDGGNMIELKSSAGEGITLDTVQGALSIKCKKFELDVQGNKLTIDPTGAVLECNPSVSIKAATVSVEGTGTSTVKGAILNLESSGVANLKGSMVKIG